MDIFDTKKQKEYQIKEIIEKKKNGEILTKEEIIFFVDGFTNGRIPDYQMSALLMAIVLKGMTNEETFYLTEAMINSGDTLDYSDIDGLIVDKHSSGGIGDKTTLIIVPIVASLGCKVAKMSGRGLGYTGGTIDKLESIKGFNCYLNPEEFKNSLKKIGAAIIAQTGNLVPADKKIYALRDVTGTVESIPLIASSIMSKKIASGADIIVLDIKVGSGAFMKNISDAEKLAQLSVDIGKRFNRKVVALLTNMDSPLGNAIGNKLEVKEAVNVLNGKEDNELKELCITLATEMYSLAKDIDFNDGKIDVIHSINSGLALNKFQEIIKNQDGDYLNILAESKATSVDILSIQNGYISNMNLEKIGSMVCNIGAGKKHLDDIIDSEVGLIVHKTIGDYVNKGEKIATLYINDLDKIEEAKDDYLNALIFSEKEVEKKPLIYKIVR